VRSEELGVTQNSPAIAAVDAGLADGLTELIARAAAAVLATGPALLRTKADRTPVTAADEASNTIIADGLARLVPGLPVVSEENLARTDVVGTSLALVDPLDGTKEFIAGRAEYTINIAIVTDGRPIAGFIAVPALGLIFRGLADRGAERLALDRRNGPAAIRCRKNPSGPLVAAVSRSHLDPATIALLDRLAVKERLACGSALKFCRIAEGGADVYPRLSATSEWDIAAGDALVTAAGGVVTTAAGIALRYGRSGQNFLVPDFVAWGDPARNRYRR
jgi:3'(2'), 5'-bisphosphate nucleotidase